MKKKLLLLVFLVIGLLFFRGGHAKRVKQSSAGVEVLLILSDRKYVITSPHIGYAGPRVGIVRHVNLIIWNSSNRKVRNYHVSWEKCLYIWESMKLGEVWYGCDNDNPLPVFGKRLLRRVDLLWAAVGYLLITLIWFTKRKRRLVW